MLEETEEEVASDGQETEATEKVAGEETVELSLADIEELIEQRLESAYQQWQRAVQSQLDKRESGLSKRMREQIAQATAFAEAAKGRGLTEEQVAALQGDLVRKGITALLPEEDDPKGHSSPEPDVNAINQLGQYLFDQYGLAEDDPEYKTIKTNGTPEQYLESIRVAGIKKQFRTQVPAPQKKGKAKPKTEEEDEEDEGEVKEARVPGIGPSGGRAPVNPIAKITDRGELYRMAGIAAKQKRQTS